MNIRFQPFQPVSTCSRLFPGAGGVGLNRALTRLFSNERLKMLRPKLSRGRLEWNAKSGLHGGRVGLRLSPVRGAVWLRVLRMLIAKDPLNLIQVMLAKGSRLPGVSFA